MEIPSFFGQWTAVWSVTGVTRELACTCGYANPGDIAPGTVATEIRDAGMAGVDNIFDTAQYDASCTLDRIYILQNRGGILESATVAIGQVGSAAIDPIPVNTGVVVAKETARAGRQFRGRWIWPSAYLDEGEVNEAAEMSVGARGALQDGFDLFFGGLVSRGLPPALLHSQPQDPLAPIPGPTPVTSFIVRTQIGSARRRLKRFTG